MDKQKDLEKKNIQFDMRLNDVFKYDKEMNQRKSNGKSKKKVIVNKGK